MQLSIHGKQMDLGDSLKTHISDKLEDINQKYFNRAIEAIVTLSPEGHAFTKSHVSIRVGKDILVQGTAQDTDPYASFDQAADKVAKQLRRYKKRLRDHHERLEKDVALPAQNYVISPDTNMHEHEDQEPDHKEPVVVAEMATNIQTMSVSEAVMRLDLSEENALMFRNAQHEGLNMVYRRHDGNIGWIDPEGNQVSVSPKAANA
ncbi:MAG: ribosome-associated translation inhibitor RaiA [Alphaproteobacteria bacterium]|nr:ribosome-associated translation inhibitor RaiA [Alphaproteobacteria bacterium]